MITTLTYGTFFASEITVFSFAYRSFKIGCPGLIHLIARKDHLYIKKIIREHANHNCTVEEVRIIPETRKVHNDDQDTLETLLDGKVRPSRIRMIHQDTQSGRITPRDIANYR